MPRFKTAPYHISIEMEKFVAHGSTHSHRRSLVSWDFDNYKAFKKAINRAIVRMASEVKNKNLYNDINIKFTELPVSIKQQYSTADAEPIVKALLSNPELLNVSSPAWFLSEEQRSRIVLHTINNRAKHHLSKTLDYFTIKSINIKHLSMKSLYFIPVALLVGPLLTNALIAGTAATFAMKMLMSVLMSASVFAVFTVFAGFVLKLKALGQAEKIYNMQGMDGVTDPNEMQALKPGAKVTNWWDYSKSYLQWPAYSNYKALAGAFSHAMNSNESNEEKTVKKINSRI